MVYVDRCLVDDSGLSLAKIARYAADLSNGNNLGLYFLNMFFCCFLVSFFHEEYQKGISHEQRHSLPSPRISRLFGDGEDFCRYS